MNEAQQLARYAALLADPARATMLLSLVGNRARPAGELARHAGLSAQAASNHLKLLLDAGLVALEAAGRHRYYRLANADVADLLEAMSSLPGTVRLDVGNTPPPLRFARRCYDHLAGSLAVRLTAAMREQHWLEEDLDGWKLGSHGPEGFTRLGIDLDLLARHRRPLLRVCLDWSERTPHLAGSLGAALLTRCLEAGWLVAPSDSRALQVTPAGQHMLAQQLGVPWLALSAATGR